MLGQLRRLSAWVFLLFIVAQIGTTTPLLYVDILHEFGRLDSGISTGVGVTEEHGQPTQHQRGVNDEHDQCCSLHHGLIGTLTAGSTQIIQDIIALPLERPRAEPARGPPNRIYRPPAA
jgi:hypothetical protein